ncbi:Sjogren's syndrome/scleroderma autoantigen 1 family protein [Halopenitus salinus]|uniref:Sjogren's syndrome/scleroderma autoantigen 1 family protein n=1 Tax=Halopenitus salinus TaxID=1198295 RepID=A0ABD5V0H3_9EURY
MSEEFDKEAEREKLREKYERDRKKREHTQHMSELLLKGATMTNSHCDACGDPIFRHDGREFCPTCAREDAAEETGAEIDAGAETTTNGAGSNPESTAAGSATNADPADPSPPDEHTVDAGSPEEHTANANTANAADANTDAPTANGSAERNVVEGRPTPERAAPSEPAGTNAPSRPASDAIRSEGDPRAGHRETNPDPSEDLRAARESLSRTVRRFAEAAERADGPRRAREDLEAAREAAEALSALDR